ncbi:MAG: LptE family protein [Elusimicrobia bacterium]|nr:LptE family protein [Elusimicrobiota bacterium]
MRKLALVLVAAALTACGGPEVGYKPAPQLLPSHIQKLALRPIVNKTQQFGLEDKLALAVRDEFLRDARYPLTPESEADGIVWITISRYILTPIHYDATLAPTNYKLRVLVDVQMIDRASNQTIWEEKNLESSLAYPAPTLIGGLTEEQAREQIWSVLAPMIVKRVVSGFGAVTGTSERRITGDAPSTAPNAAPEKPLTPVVPAPY